MDGAAGGSHWTLVRLVSPPTPACMLWTLIRLGWIDKESELGLTGFLWLRLEGRHCLFGSGC